MTVCLKWHVQCSNDIRHSPGNLRTCIITLGYYVHRYWCQWAQEVSNILRSLRLHIRAFALASPRISVTRVRKPWPCNVYNPISRQNLESTYSERGWAGKMVEESQHLLHHDSRVLPFEIREGSEPIHLEHFGFLTGPGIDIVLISPNCDVFLRFVVVDDSKHVVQNIFRFGVVEVRRRKNVKFISVTDFVGGIACIVDIVRDLFRAETNGRLRNAANGAREGRREDRQY